MMVPNLIAGVLEGADAGLEIVSPWRGEAVRSVALATANQVDRALAAAYSARPIAAAVPRHRRAEILRAVATGLIRDRTEFAALMVEEAGKPIDFALGEVDRAVQTFRLAAAEAETAQGNFIPLDVAKNGVGRAAIVRRVPAGVVLGITPFNFPLNLVAHKLAPAIAAGCPVLIKPSEKTPSAALRLGQLCIDAGWPAPALSVFNTTLDRTKALIGDPRIAVLSFTGSDRVGWALKAASGRAKTLLELGGDAATIIAPDWTIDDATMARVAFGAFAFSGQVCISVQRVLVPADRLSEATEALVAAARAVAMGEPETPGVVLGALVDDTACAKVARIIGATETAGARRLCGEQRGARRWSPMVFDRVPDGAPFATEELFGPGICIEPYTDFDAAIARVNSSRFGLQTGVFTHDHRLMNQSWRDLEVGGVIIGDIPTWRADPMPYGGVKASGVGREGPRYAIEDFTEPRMMVIPDGP